MAKAEVTKNRLNDCWNTIGVWSTAEDRCERLNEVIHCRNCDVFSRAGREVLERNAPGGYIAQWQKTIAAQEEGSKSALPGVMIFRLGDEWFAVSAQSLQEIADKRVIRRVPHNENPHIAGVVNIGGEIVVCYSMAELLGVDRREDAQNSYTRLMVVACFDEKYIFPVNEVMGMTRFLEEDVLPIPATLGEEKSQFIEKIFLHDNKHITMLRIENICQSIGRVMV